MMKVCNNDSEIDHFLQVVDPYNNQHITFSECLSLFSSVLIILSNNMKELVNSESREPSGQITKKTVSLLEKFTSDDGGIEVDQD
jgi:hypothetical protein